MTENSAIDQPAASQEEPAVEPAPLTSADPFFADPSFAERYGVKPGMSRVRKVTLGVVGLGILCGVAGYIAWNEANPQIQATVVDYTTTPNSITVTFQVNKPANQAVECTVQAVDVKGDVIGQANVSVAAGRAQEDVLYTVNTTGTPNTATVPDCVAN